MNTYSIDLFINYENKQSFEFNFYCCSESIEKALKIANANIPSAKMEFEIAEANIELQNDTEISLSNNECKLVGKKEY